MTRQQQEENKEEKPSGRPVKGIKRERKSIMLPLDQIAYLESHRSGTWSKLLSDALAETPKFQAWRKRHWEPKHQEPSEAE